MIRYQKFNSKRAFSIYSILFLTLGLSLVLLACDPLDDNTISGKWKLLKYHNISTDNVEGEPSDIKRSIIIEFSDDTVDGTIVGQTVVNEVGGSYKLLPNNKMKTISFGGTKIAEPNWGAQFWDAMHAASSYQRFNTRLWIFYNNDSEKMEFKKH